MLRTSKQCMEAHLPCTSELYANATFTVIWRRNGALSKVIPPPTVEKFYKVKLHIEGPPHVIIEQQTSNKSGCLWLLCELDGLDSTEVNLTWSQNGQSIPETTSSLHLCKPDWSEGDTFTCNISQSSNYTGLSANITITQTHSRVVCQAVSLVLISVGTLTGTLTLNSALFFKWRSPKRKPNGHRHVH
ncbi:hypothetical protein SKAU_G00262320 [Synaphobranchus kaupii]|uniref:Ig-like domain-containing protein n=1 Tax=Synaphobranchus kaupii TaxID=118154 RepID=A0A9Q1EYQ4_SYNKA|nr:hypothetical protein SKAU_G00262320 [Synaphobranchus kaupii]